MECLAADNFVSDARNIAPHSKTCIVYLWGNIVGVFRLGSPVVNDADPGKYFSLASKKLFDGEEGNFRVVRNGRMF